MSLTYTIAIHGSPYATMAHQHGLCLCQALVAGGHRIHRVFFYHDAVNVALASMVPPQDEADLSKAWSEFGSIHQVELAVCIANGLKRGVVSAGEAERYELPGPTLAEPFELVGLGQLIDGIANSDRYIEVPA